MIITTIIILLIGCSSDQTSSDDKKDTVKKGDKEQITISFGTWNKGTEDEPNLERSLIKAFEAEYPHIKIELDQSIPNDRWTDGLATAASAKQMPDVFMLAEVPPGVANEWLLDITVIASNDPEFTNVPQAVRDAATYNNIIYAVPAGQQFLGYYVNKDLYNQANLDVPEHGMSIDDFVSSVRDITNINEGKVGFANAMAILDWYPTAVTDNLGWYTLTDEGYHLDSKEFINGLNLASNLMLGGNAYEGLTDEQKANFSGEWGGEVFVNGGIGLTWDGTWAIPFFEENAEFDWDFVSIPGGRTVVANDYMGISKTTEHPEEAYLFAKWMSFGKKGYLKRLEIAQEEGFGLDSLPVTTDQEILDAYFELQSLPGLRKAYENLDKAVVEPVKTVPGYVQSRWEAPTGVAIEDNLNANISQLLEAAVKGTIKIEDYITQINDLANNQYKEANDAIAP